MVEEKTDFQSIRDSFEMLWDGVPYEKGKGYKQFRRWEWFMQQRMYPSNNYFNPMAAWEEWEKLRESGAFDQKKSLGEWTSLGPANWTNTDGWNPGNGRINVIVQDPNDSNIIYIGAASGGLWKSVDGGINWVSLTDNQAVLGVSGIAVNPDDSNIIYLGTGDGDGFDTYSVGVLKSIDGGITWNTTGLNWAVYDGRAVRKILMHPDNPDILYAATSAGLFKTSNGGDTWVQAQGGNIQGVEFHPENPDIVYTCSDRFYRSVNGGFTFQNISSGLPSSLTVNRLKIAVSPDQPDWVYVLAGKSSDSTFKGLYQSGNSGASFVTKTETPNMFGYDQHGDDDAGQSWYDMAIAVNPFNANEVFIGGINVWKSTDGGSNFKINTQWYYPNPIGYVHADIHELAFFGNRLYCGSDGGIYKTDDNGENWQNLTNGITIMQFYDISIAPEYPDLILAGAQDNGTNLYTGSPTWAHVIGADGMVANINPQNPDIMYGAIQYGDLYKSFDGGEVFYHIVGPDDFNESGAWVTPYVLSPDDPNTIYLGYRSIFKSIDGGITWAALNNVGNNDATNRIAIAPSNASVIYISKSGKIYRTQDDGDTWANISDGLPNLTITDIAVDPYNADRLWVTFSAYNAGAKVYQSTNGGANWTNISYNLPNLPANCVAYYPVNDELHIGMDVGIFSRQIAENFWTPNVEGLPNVIINDLEINPINKKIYAGSFGRSVWVADLQDIGTYLAIGGDLSLSEGDTGLTTFEFIIERSGDLSDSSSVAWTVSGSGTYPADADDFEGGAFPSGMISFQPGSVFATILINVAGDTEPEPDESFIVTLFNPTNAGLIIATANGLIKSDDGAPVPLLSISGSQAKKEGNSGYTPFTFTISRSGYIEDKSIVNWEVAGSGANPADPADFAGGVFTGGTVIFSAGSSASKTITIYVSGDEEVEPDEEFSVSLAGSQNAFISVASATGAILNDDFEAVSSISLLGNLAQYEGDTGLTPFKFTVKRTEPLSGESSVNWKVNGSGSRPTSLADFENSVMPTGTLSFPPNSEEGIIIVNVRGDTDVEPNEEFRLTLTNPVNANIVTATVFGTILNDDFVVATEEQLPESKGQYLLQNQPNPFDLTTSIRYQLPEGAKKSLLQISDVKGRLLKEIELSGTGGGEGEVAIEAGELAPGVYSYSLLVNGLIVQTRQMVLTK